MTSDRTNMKIKSVTDKAVEVAAKAMERARNTHWTDKQFEIWWNKDPFFCKEKTSWGFFSGTRKGKCLWEARKGLEAIKAFELASTEEACQLDSNSSSTKEQYIPTKIPAGMPEYDALLDHLFEYGTMSEGTHRLALKFALALFNNPQSEDPLLPLLRGVAQEQEPRVKHTCSLGVGCEESGVCYALANGQPEQCGKPSNSISNAVMT